MNYYFGDFTEENYRAILEKLICMGYKFSGFDYEIIHSDINLVLWRHDIDFSLNRAYKLAEIEEGLGIKATYFIHMHNCFYNIFEPGQYEFIEKIANMGHAIGLHFDHGFYTQSKHIMGKNEIERYVVMEKEIIEKYFGISINAVSFHNPEASNVLDLQKDYYAGMVNTYAKAISDNYKYCSDSNGYWRYDRLQDVIEKKYRKLHILTHPAWWTPYEMSPYERIKRCADGRNNASIDAYSDLLNKCGRKNIGYQEYKQ